MKRIVSLLVIVLSFITGCGSKDNCVPGSTRCNGDLVEVCNTSNNFDKTDDCKYLSGLNNVELACFPPILDPSDSGVEMERAACLPVNVTDTGIYR